MRLFLAPLILWAGLTAAAAQTPTSAYTKTIGSDCKTRIEKQDGQEIGSTAVCKGFGGIAVTLYEDDSRVAVSYGRKPSAEPAAKVFFGPLNSVGDMLEWRIVAEGGARKPFATILRWRLNPVDDNGDPKKLEVLVVTRLAPGPICHVAYVDAEANRDANELARKAADETARGFRCGIDKPALIGAKGRAEKYLSD